MGGFLIFLILTYGVDKIRGADEAANSALKALYANTSFEVKGDSVLFNGRKLDLIGDEKAEFSGRELRNMSDVLASKYYTTFDLLGGEQLINKTYRNISGTLVNLNATFDFINDTHVNINGKVWDLHTLFPRLEQAANELGNQTAGNNIMSARCLFSSFPIFKIKLFRFHRRRRRGWCTCCCHRKRKPKPTTTTPTTPSPDDVPTKHLHRTTPSPDDVPTKHLHRTTPSPDDVPTKHLHRTTPSPDDVLTKYWHRTTPSPDDVPTKHLHRTTPSPDDVPTKHLHRTTPSPDDVPTKHLHRTTPSPDDIPIKKLNMCIMLNILSISTVDQEVRYFNVLRAFLMFIKHASSNDLEFREVFWEEFSAYYKSQEKLLLDQDLRVALFEHVMFQSKSICAQENCYELKILTFKIILRSLLKFIDDTSREYPQLMFKLFASFVQVSLKTNEAISVDIYHILEEISIELRKKIISKKFTVAIQQCKVRYGIK